MPVFNKIQTVVEKELKAICKELGVTVNSIESRIKTPVSLAGKLELKGYKYKDIFDITDIFGARVITFYSDEVDKLAAVIEKHFVIDHENSVDKRNMYKVDQFGYMSLHFICCIPEKLYTEDAHPEINRIKFEIQLRTTLQHAWASIYHDTGYKSDVEVPVEFLRSLNRLAGLLELADEEFTYIRVSLDEYRRKVKQIVASGNFNDVELTGDSFKAYIEAGGFDRLNKKIAEINNMEIQQVNCMNYLPILKRFELKSLGDLENLKSKYGRDAHHFAIRQFSETDIDIVASSIGLYYLCVVYIIEQRLGETGLTLFFDYIYGERKSNARTAKKAMEIADQMGLLTEGE